MYELALFFSIISSILFIIYLLMAIFGQRQRPEDNTITIRGQFVTRVVDGNQVRQIYPTIEHY